MAMSRDEIFEKVQEVLVDALGVDDDEATRWATDSGTHQAWLEVDLGKTTTFNRVKITEAYDRVKKFELQYKNNGLTSLTLLLV